MRGMSAKKKNAKAAKAAEYFSLWLGRTAASRCRDRTAASMWFERKKILCGLGGLCVLLLCASRLAAQSGVPRYEVDTSWPKPFPDRWVLGGLGGVCVDARDHVFILNRQDILESELNAGRLAPPIIELDADGSVVNSWGDAKLLDPRLHSCFVDAENNIWIASSPSGMVQKYSHDGRTLLFQIGTKGVLDSSDGTVKGKPLNSNAAKFFMPSSLFVDPGNGDVYVSDGESRNGNRRIAVIDRRGTFVRQWQPEGMQTVHCMAVSSDGWVYVCNREGARIQVYDKSGAFVKNIDVPWKPFTPAADGIAKESGGSAVSLELSRDAGQRFMYVINQNNAQVEIIDRASGKILSSVGRGAGHFPGQFDQPHGLAVDAQGNIYVTENRGRRIQKFKFVGR
jgi:sugar lactone lactonase YvrE